MNSLESFEQMHDEVEFFIWTEENDDILQETWLSSKDDVDCSYDEFLELEFRKYLKNHPRNVVFKK
jgi:hypothetical protein